MKNLLTLLLSCLLLPSTLVPTVTAAAFAQTPDEIVEKHLAAMGGREALGKLTSRKATGTISVSTQAGDLSGPAELYSKAPRKSRAVMRLDLTPLGAAGEMIVEQRFDGTSGWSLNSMQGDVEITGHQLANLRNNMFPSGLLNYKAAGVTLEVLPQEKINGRNAIVLRITPKAGAGARLFFDAETYLMMRTITTLESPMGGDMDHTSDASDYRAVDGVKVPFQIVNTNQLQTIKIKLDKVEHNVAMDDAMFGKGGVSISRFRTPGSAP